MRANLEQKQAASTPRGKIGCLSKELVNARVFRKYAMLSVCLSVPRAEVYLNFLNVTEKRFTKPFPSLAYLPPRRFNDGRGCIVRVYMCKETSIRSTNAGPPGGRGFLRSACEVLPVQP